MFSSLPEEILHIIALKLNRSSLGKLSLVCKRISAICLPIFYWSVIIDHATVARWANAPAWGRHLMGTRAFQVGYLVDDFWNYGVPDENLLPILYMSLQKMPKLRSFKIYGLLGNCLDRTIAGYGANIWDVLKLLQNLTEVLIYNKAILDIHYKFNWKIPCFTNLTSLALHRLDGADTSDNFSGIVETLLDSPGLKHLGLTRTVEGARDNYMLRTVISEFTLKRQGRPRLQLKSLHLGMGTFPGFFGPSTRYSLDDLTDLTYLTTLQVDNRIFEELYSPQPAYEMIDSSLFTRAKNLRRITVERLSFDIISLIRLMREVQSPPKLDALELMKYRESLETEFYDHDYPGESLYSVPLWVAGYLWRRLCYKGPLVWGGAFAQNVLVHFLPECDLLEELIISLEDQEELESLKFDTLPTLHSLHTLHLAWGYLVDLAPTCHGTLQSRGLSILEKEKLMQHHRELMVEYEQRQLMPVVHELFAWHIHLRSKQQNMSSLRYVAIGETVYTRRFISGLSAQIPNKPTEQETDTMNKKDLYTLQDGSMIAKLGCDEAMEIGIVETLHYQWTFKVA